MAPWSFTTFSTSESTSIYPLAGLPANLSGLLSKSSYGNAAMSKKAGRTGKYAGETCAIVRLSGQANRESLVLD
jgi:hypothetical protein